MPKRKNADGDDLEGDKSVPLPIQTFLWRQTSPFIRPKLGKLCEASCVSFERVLVQNILHGLSPSLCEAIQSVTRWKIIQVAFPHVMHCCAAVLAGRKQNNPNAKFDSNETKLLYTLHWLILDAASECEDMEIEKAGGKHTPAIGTFLYSLECIQLFVYLFAPLVSSFKDSDFQSLKLENGLRLWQFLWEFRQPEVPCFSTLVKPKRNVIKAQRNLLKVNFNAANIYIGKGTSTENIYLGFEDVPGSRCSGTESASPLAPLARLSDICALSTTETQSTSVEIVCEVCNEVMQNNKGELSCKCGVRRASYMSVTNTARPASPIDKDYIAKRLESAVAAGPRSAASMDFLSASYFDVAVLRCLFCPQWAEDGIYWALKYIHQRLLEVCEEMHRVEYVRERSKSLPIPDIQVSPPCQSPTPPTPPSPSKKDLVHLENILNRRDSLMVGGTGSHEHRKEPAFKRMKGVIEEKVSKLRRRESSEQFEVDGHGKETGRISPELLNGHLNEPPPPTRSTSALGKLNENEEDSYEEDHDSCDSASDLVRRRSMPALRRMKQPPPENDADEDEAPGQHPLLTKDSVSRAMSLKPEMLQKPIITITEDSPDPSPSPSWIGTCKRESIASERSDRSDNLHRPLSLQRSMTDSNISYQPPDEVEEVPGSVYYIQPSGEMNYMVILQAAHLVSSQQCSSRVCSVLLNILYCLLDLDIIEKTDSDTEKKAKEDVIKDDKSDDEKKDTDSKKGYSQKTAHNITMETIMRIFKSIGCPHGCGDGFRGKSGEELRIQGIGCLSRLQKVNPAQFRHFFRDILIKQPLQEIIDFMHSLLGFCVDPSINAMSPQGPGPKKGNSQDGGRTGYANNFGEPMGKSRTVESIIITQIFKSLVTRFTESRKELLGHENIGLYCDVRQFMNFVKETHGSSFRRVALSGLIDAVLRPKNKDKDKAKTTKVVSSRRSTTVPADSDDSRSVISASDESCNAKARRSLFRRKTKKQILPPYGAVSDSELLEESLHSGKLSPRVSMSATEDDPPSGSSTPKRKFSKFNIAWKRATKSDHEDDSASETPTLEPRHDRHESRPSVDQSSAPNQRTKPRMSFKAASQATLSFLSARKRIEDGLRNWSRRRFSKRGSIDGEGNRRGSLHEGNILGTEVLIVREKKLVNAYAVKSGMFRFNFMLDCCHPGSLPDAHLIAALLDLEAPVVARSTLLLECAHFVNRCNRGDWPNWMKLNLPGFRQTGLLNSRGQPSGYRRNIMLQRAAGRMFHMWGEALGNRMYELLSEENADRFAILHQIKDEQKKKELRMEDDEEDFLDEATVNPTGSASPFALKMVACQVLLEITTFLRETYQYIPKTRLPRRDQYWEKNVSSRRWSCALSSPGHSERSNSRSSQGENPIGSPGDRKISFAVFGQSERSDSIHSSQTSLSAVDGNSESGRRLAAGRKLLKMRRGSGHNSSFRQNRSFKLKRTEGGSIKRVGSGKGAPRKVSTQSLKSDRSDDEHSGEADSGGMMSDENQESPDYPEPDEQDYSKYMPWIKVVVQLANTSNFICDHQNFCHPNCYERQRRSCSRLMTAVRKVYESQPGDALEQERRQRAEEASRDMLRDKLKRRELEKALEESMFQPSSPTRRRESTPLLEKINLKADINVARAKIAAALEKKGEEPKKPVKPKDESPMMKFLRTQVQHLTQSPMSIITKAAPILLEDSFIDMLPVAWELMLESDQELAASAATVFILSSVKAPDQVQDLMIRELQHEDVNQRINAILRFGVLWRFRYQVWPRMEDGANMFFKVPPPSIDFVLPSPTIGLPSLLVIDPPWTPHFKTKVEEVTINQEESKTFVTATTTRRKQQQEMIHRALLAEEDRRRAARENFHMTTISITHQAAYEPALHQSGEEHEEGMALQEELNLAARRMSVAPLNRASNVQSRNMSWRSGSMFWPRATALYEGEEERVEHAHMHHMQLAQHFFPSCICSAALPIIHLLEDLEVNADGVSVSEVAERVIWNSLVEEPALFMRSFLEKLTNKEKQEELVFLLRKLVYHIPELPAQTAHTLFNYLVGFVMFYVRSPTEGGHEAIGQALSILWQIVPSVQGIFFKDLKQTLKKEQCDPTLMITANVPSAKKLIVHGPDLTSIPSQFPIHEDTQFSLILQDSLDFFNIPEEEHGTYFLVDTKTNQMHNLNSYVRDFYFFRRNFYPQLSLVHMNPDEASRQAMKQALVLKQMEMGKVLFSLAIIQSGQTQQIQNHVTFLHEELLKLPSFPRKALEAEFGLYKGEIGKELYGSDMMHKYVWTKLMAHMFGIMSSTFTLAGDLPLFLNVVNGTLLLHCEDTAMLRFCIATFINASRHFKQVFATSGFLFIMPTIVKVYSNSQSNEVLCSALEFACRQFYTLHRKPFMLQMFGSVAAILNVNPDPAVLDYTKVDPRALFNLLLALEKDCPDNLDILDLVEGEKPLTALDFCYIEDPDTFGVIDAINMCVTVVAYACDSMRGMQMLTILEAILPHYLRHIREQTRKRDNHGAAREEVILLSNLAVSMRALVSGGEALTRNFSGPQRHLETRDTNIKPTQNHSNHSPQGANVFNDEPSMTEIRFMEEGIRSNKGRHGGHVSDDDADVTLNEFRRPRNSLLCIVAQIFKHSTNRMRELRRDLADPSFRAPELMDSKAHNRLADIAHTLLKVAPYDPATMRCPGLQSYICDILPITDWSQEAVRPALNLVFRRLERLFSKIAKKSVLRRNMDWDAASNLLKGVYSTLSKFHYIAHLPHLKTLINVCLNIILADEGAASFGDTLPSVPHRMDTMSAKVAAPPAFCSAVVKVTAMQMQALGVGSPKITDQYSLELICGGMSVFPSAEKTVNMLINLVLPLCIRMGCGRRDCPKIRPEDIKFALTIVLNALAPPSKHQSTPSTPASTTAKSTHLSVADSGRTSSMSSHTKRVTAGKETVLNCAFLGLKVIMVCFERQLATEWYRIARSVQDLGSRLLGGIPLWHFLDFVVTSRTPLFMLLQPFIQFRMMKVMCETEQEYFLQHLVHQKMQGYNMPHPKCKATILIELAAELRTLKEETCATFQIGEMRPRSATVATDRSDQSFRSGMARSSSIHDLLELQVNQRLSTLSPSMPGGKKYGKDEPTKVCHLSPNMNARSAQSSRQSSVSDTSVISMAHLEGFLQSKTPSPESTLLSVSSTGSQPMARPTQEGTSPVLQRKASQRITAQEGSRILEKFTKKASVQEEEPPDSVDGTDPEASVLRAASPRRLQRQASIYQRPHITKQHTICGSPSDETLFENVEAEESEDEEEANHSVPPMVPRLRPKLQRQGRVIHRGVLKTQLSFYNLSSSDPLMTKIRKGVDLNMNRSASMSMSVLQVTSTTKAVAVSPSKASVPLPGSAGNDEILTPMEAHPDFDPRSHRLQRQDAKSRKTFKIKRHRSTIKGNIIRSATVKGSLRVNVNVGHVGPHVKTPVCRTPSNEPPVGSMERLERLETQPEEDPSDGGEQEPPSSAPPVPVTTSSREPDGSRPSRPSKKRYLQRSKSHEDGGTEMTSAPAGTVRGRIARQGARIMRSRSPSTSPSRAFTSPSVSPAQSQTYVAKCDSIESLSNDGENSALLKEEDKSKSESSLLIFFDSSDVQDTCV